MNTNNAFRPLAAVTGAPRTAADARQSAHAGAASDAAAMVTDDEYEVTCGDSAKDV